MATSYNQAPGWDQFMQFLKAMEYLGGRYPGPQTPQFQAPQGLTAGEEGTILGSIEGGINRNTRQNLQTVRQNAAQRGAYRSGQLPALEGDVMKAGANATSDALANYYGGKANRLYGANMAQNQFNMGTWQQLFSAWQQNQAGLGQLFGSRGRL